MATQKPRYASPIPGDLGHADEMLGGKMLDVLDYPWKDLMRLAETLRSYAMGRALVDIRERLDALERRTTRRPRRRRGARGVA